MADHDGSLASLTEEWIAEQLRGLDEFADDAVEVFEGTTHPDGAKLIAEMTDERSPHAIVMFTGDSAVPLEEGQTAYRPTYEIYVVVHNERAGRARQGDADSKGTNWMRDVIRAALHNKVPGVSANGFHADLAEFQGVQIVYQQKGTFIMRAGLVVQERPVAA